jgi:hypothetical protein
MQFDRANQDVSETAALLTLRHMATGIVSPPRKLFSRSPKKKSSSRWVNYFWGIFGMEEGFDEKMYGKGGGRGEARGKGETFQDSAVACAIFVKCNKEASYRNRKIDS